MEQLEALKPRHVKQLDPRGRENDYNAADEDGENDDNTADKDAEEDTTISLSQAQTMNTEDGEKEDTTISLSMAQEMNTVYMEGDNSTTAGFPLQTVTQIKLHR